MAFWVLSGGAPPEIPNPFPTQHHQHQHHHNHHLDALRHEDENIYVHRLKRPVDHCSYDIGSCRHPHDGLQQDIAYDSDGSLKRARVSDWTHPQAFEQDARHIRHSYQGPEAPARNLAFYVLREGSHSTPPEQVYKRPRPISPIPTSAPMERTASGLSISSDPVYTEEEPQTSTLNDSTAATFVLKNISSSHRNSQPSRILHSLIHPPSDPNHPQFRLDNDALTSLFHAANWLFFGGRLSKRVTWDWTSEEDSLPQYDGHIIGTTALRRSASGGYETLIVLSSPILRDTRYNRRLLIATFLHEMIHSFLFISCGMKAGREGGHTEGFRRIADGIDGWVGGRQVLGLGEMDADLGRFCEDHGSGAAEGWKYQRREGFGGGRDREWDGYSR